MLEVAKDFPEYTFAVADEDNFATEVKDLGLSESGEDVNAAILDEGGRKFAMEPDEFDSDTLREFVTAFRRGGPRAGAWGHWGHLFLPIACSEPGSGAFPGTSLREDGGGASPFFCLLSLFSFFFLVLEKRAGVSQKC